MAKLPAPRVATGIRMLSAVASYAVYLIASAALLGLFAFVYTKVTPFDEIALIHAGNSAAALSLGGALLGFSLTLASSIVHNASLVSVVLWAIGAMIVQVVVYAVVSRLLVTVRTEIDGGNAAMGGLLGALSLAAGVVNAACLS